MLELAISDGQEQTLNTGELNYSRRQLRIGLDQRFRYLVKGVACGSLCSGQIAIDTGQAVAQWSRDSQSRGTLPAGPGAGWSSGCQRGSASLSPGIILRVR